MPKINTFSIPKISNELALLLGMFAGDGCLSISHNGDGNRIYPIKFFNTNKAFIDLFAHLFAQVFETKGVIRNRIRTNKKDLWEFEKYSVKLYEYFCNNLEMANGKKALNVRIPSFIMHGDASLKINFFFGLLITDGSVKADYSILFHVASKGLTEDLQKIIQEVWGFKR